jgi:uncharacterized protein
MRISFLVPIVSVLAACIGYAQAPAISERRPSRPSIRTSGEATVTAKPDRAIIDLGVVAQAQTAQAAAAQNATRLDAVLREVKSAAGPGAEIKTISYSLDPNYRYPKPGGPPEIAGYTARNVVEVTTDTLDSVGKIIDSATKAGANNIERLQFTLKDEQPAKTRALRDAAAKARANAEAIAGALGVKIAGVLFAEEEAGAPQPIRPMFARAAMAETMAAPPTPVAAGTLEIHGTVTLTVEITQ